MVEYTNYNEFTRPEEGQDIDLWGGYLNTNINDYDRQIPMLGPLGDLPDAATIDDQEHWFIATDTSPVSLWYYDGASWEVFWDGDADTLGGQASAWYASRNRSETINNDWTFDSNVDVTGAATVGSTLDVSSNVTTPGIDLDGTASAYVHADRTLDNLRGHFIGTNADGDGHIPLVLRQASVNTLIAENGNVSIPNGALDVSGTTTLGAGLDTSGDITSDGNVYLPGDYGSVYLGGTLRLMHNPTNDSFHLRNSTDDDILIGNQAGDVDIPRGSLDVNGNVTAESALDVLGHTTLTADADAEGQLTVHDGPLTATNRSTSLDTFTVLPSGYVEQDALNFRFDQNVLSYCENYATVTTTPSIDDSGIENLFRIEDGIVDMNAVNGGGEVVVEVTDISISNSANRDFWPYYFTHAGADAFGYIKMETRNEDGVWEVAYEGSGGGHPDFYVADDYRMSVGTLTGARWTFNNVDSGGGRWIRNLGVIGQNAPSQAWSIRKNGDTMYGSFDVTENVDVGGDLDVGGATTLGGNLNLGDNNLNAAHIVRANQLDITDGTLNVFDPTNSQQAFQVHEGGNVAVPNGSLSVSGDITTGGDSVATQPALTSHTGDTSNPHSVTLEQARTAGSTMVGLMESDISDNDFWHLTDGSGGSNTSPYTMRFDDRDWRLYAGGTNGIGGVLQLYHDSGDVDVLNGALDVAGSITTGGDVNAQSGTIYPIAETDGVAWDLDSTNGPTWAKIQFNDANGDDVYWTSNRSSGDAFKVTNSTANNDIFALGDAGTVDLINDLTVDGGDIIAAPESGVGGQVRSMDLILNNNESSSGSYGNGRVYANYAQEPQYGSYKTGTWGFRLEHIGDSQTLALWNWNQGNRLELPTGALVENTLDATGTISAGTGLYTPTYAATANATATESDVIYIDGSGTDAAGLYYHDGAGYNRLASGGGASALSELSIDTSKDWQGYNITNLGNVAATGSITINSDPVPTASAGQYDIQKNGTDGAGVINFKTS